MPTFKVTRSPLVVDEGSYENFARKRRPVSAKSTQSNGSCRSYQSSVSTRSNLSTRSNNSTRSSLSYASRTDHSNASVKSNNSIKHGGSAKTKSSKKAWSVKSDSSDNLSTTSSNKRPKKTKSKSNEKVDYDGLTNMMRKVTVRRTRRWRVKLADVDEDNEGDNEVQNEEKIKKTVKRRDSDNSMVQTRTRKDSTSTTHSNTSGRGKKVRIQTEPQKPDDDDDDDDNVSVDSESRPVSRPTQSMRRQRSSYYSQYKYPQMYHQGPQTLTYAMERNIPQCLRQFPRYCSLPVRQNCKYTPVCSVTHTNVHSVESRCLPHPDPSGKSTPRRRSRPQSAASATHPGGNGFSSFHRNGGGPMLQGSLDNSTGLTEADVDSREHTGNYHFTYKEDSVAISVDSSDEEDNEAYPVDRQASSLSPVGMHQRDMYRKHSYTGDTDDTETPRRPADVDNLDIHDIDEVDYDDDGWTHTPEDIRSIVSLAEEEKNRQADSDSITESIADETVLRQAQRRKATQGYHRDSLSEESDDIIGYEPDFGPIDST